MKIAVSRQPIEDDTCDVEDVDIRCARCGKDDDLNVWHYPGIPILALCAECDDKES